MHDILRAALGFPPNTKLEVVYGGELVGDDGSSFIDRGITTNGVRVSVQRSSTIKEDLFRSIATEYPRHRNEASVWGISCRDLMEACRGGDGSLMWMFLKHQKDVRDQKPMKEHIFPRMIDLLDSDGDGIVLLEDFIAQSEDIEESEIDVADTEIGVPAAGLLLWWYHIAWGGTPTELEDAYNTLNFSKRSGITFHDLRTYIHQEVPKCHEEIRSHFVNFSDDELQEMIDWADYDGDGVVSEEELQRAVRDAGTQRHGKKHGKWHTVPGLLWNWAQKVSTPMVMTCRMLGTVNGRGMVGGFGAHRALGWGDGGTLLWEGSVLE